MALGLPRSVGLVAASILFCLVVSGPAHAGTPAPQQDADGGIEQRLVERYAPAIMVRQQDEPCDAEGEPYGPTSVEIVLDNPEIALRQVGSADPVVRRAPGASDLFRLGEGFYLDFPGSSLSPGCIYERDFEKYAADVPPTAYAHIVRQSDEPGVVFVQYWFYWYYNDWNNKHESDWEGITLRFNASSLGEALERGPVAVGYAQHEGGERADWDAAKLERVGDHPVVYASAGSHASYFGSAVYLGRGASEGFGCDDTTGPSERLDVDVVVLPDAVDEQDDSLAWLAFEGRWGERHRGAFNGPTGPAVKDRWLDPASWFDDLRSSSVVIPAGDSRAAEVIDVFCGLVERGSGALITWMVSPTNMLVGLLVIGLVARVLIRRTDWSPVGVEPVAGRRRAGQILRAAFRVCRERPVVPVVFGVVYLPAALLTGALVALVELVPIVVSLVSLAGRASGTSLGLAVLAGSVANVAAFIVVNAVVAAYLDRSATGFAGAVRAIRAAWARRRALLAAFGWSFTIVFVLLVSLVGVPWGIRQLVRYQFVAQAVMVDDRSGRAALARSSDLVRGRWWHTALLVGLVQGVLVVTTMVAGLLLLVVSAGIPLWTFSVLVSVVHAVVVPVAAIALTLLYGDARAEHEADETTEPHQPSTSPVR